MPLPNLNQSAKYYSATGYYSASAVPVLKQSDKLLNHAPSSKRNRKKGKTRMETVSSSSLCSMLPAGTCVQPNNKLVSIEYVNCVGCGVVDCLSRDRKANRNENGNRSRLFPASHTLSYHLSHCHPGVRRSACSTT